VTTLNGTALDGADAFWPAYRKVRAGDTARVRVLRSGTSGTRDTLELQFAPDSVAHERFAGVTVAYEAIRSDRGYPLRTVVTRPSSAGGKRLPAVLFVPWLSCDPVEKPDPRGDGFQHLLHEVAKHSGMLFLRVEKPGLGDSEGPDCRQGGLTDELAAYRSALRALRAREDVDTTRLVLLGGSIGGALAPLLAAEDPRGILGVIAVGGFTRTWYEHMLDIERRRLTLGGQSPAAVNVAMRGLARFYTEYLVGRHTPREVIETHPELAPLWSDDPGHQYGRPAHYYQDVQQLDIEAAWEQVAKHGIPSLIVWGEYDWIMGRAEPDRAMAILQASGARDATLAVLPKTDHGLFVYPSAAAAFADSGGRYDGRPGQVVNDWLRRHARSARPPVKAREPATR
jgi:pimeloyl-ACP methyl ester carboxylesterase